jgi:hypothetical protein
MDWPGADKIAERLKPPAIAAQEKQEEEGAEKIDPQIEQQMNTMADQMQHLSQELQRAQAVVNEKENDLEIKRFEAQTKRMQVEADIAIKQGGLIHEMALADLAHTVQQTNTGEADDADETTEPKEQATTPPQQESQPISPSEHEEPNPAIMDAINGLKDTHEQSHKEILTALNRKKTIIRDPQSNRIVGVE